ncbi:ABC transporter permease [Pelagicoccus albus]|uniref:ABC transporter permease n=1 Tax=Pelagicoccus albus TaxID=415222 RepID=A0A7X1B7M5_9BACT|nr:ABC transporter permease [Pelagicoccus albus]MBC2607166.1 ABC transporter permease [Pelagicoccus albus]
MRPVLILLQKDISLFLKDKAAIALTFIVPFCVIYIVGNIFGGSGDQGGISSSIRLGLLDEASNPTSQIIVDALEAEEGLRIISSSKGPEGEQIPLSRDTIQKGIEDHDFNFALIIPQDLLSSSELGLRLEFLSNPKNPIESQIINGLIQKAVFSKIPQLLSEKIDQQQRDELGPEKYSTFQNGIAAAISLAYDDIEYDDVKDKIGFAGLTDLISGSEGESEDASNSLSNLVNIEESQVFGKEVKNPTLTRMIGGYAIMFLLFATTGSAASLFEERNEGLFLRLLSMPVRRTHILWSKFLFNTLLGMVQALTLFIASSFLFGVEVFPHFLNLILVSLVASAACAAFGMTLASLAKTPQQAQGFGTLLIISMSALGGAWFPLSLMPATMQFIGKFTLVYWGVESYLGALWEDAQLLKILPELGVLAAIACCLLALSSWRFKTGDLFR